MYYGAYKGIRNAAWQCLVDCDVSQLPVNLMQIAKMAKIHVCKDSLAQELARGEHGLCLLDEAQWYIIYDDHYALLDRRLAIAHEMGHIFLGHQLSVDKDARQYPFPRPCAETAADTFALRLLSPACVLWALNLHTPQEIANVCKIPLPLATKRASRMKTLYTRKKFLNDPLEKQLLDQFACYIGEMLNEEDLDRVRMKNTELCLNDEE